MTRRHPAHHLAERCWPTARGAWHAIVRVPSLILHPGIGVPPAIRHWFRVPAVLGATGVPPQGSAPGAQRGACPCPCYPLKSRGSHRLGGRWARPRRVDGPDTPTRRRNALDGLPALSPAMTPRGIARARESPSGRRARRTQVQGVAGERCGARARRCRTGRARGRAPPPHWLFGPKGGSRGRDQQLLRG